MNEKNYEGLRKQLDNGSLDIPSQITILEIAYNLEQQLQSYKQKEDKLREYCKTETFEDIYTYIDDNVYVNPKPIFNDILQILNEGDK